MAHRQSVIDIIDVNEDMFDCIIDVRSPAEFAEDHVPGAINCPALDNEQRIEIGTLYKQVSPFVARKKGAVLALRNIAAHIEAQFSDKEKNWKPLVYCWRGGQRSGSFQTVLRAIGWEAAQLKGGYKAYRSHVLAQLKDEPRRFRYIVIGGATGSGKTDLLKVLAAKGAQVLDLEGLAQHRGSVLGFDPKAPRQSQKGFDTKLLQELKRFDPARPVFLEAESRKIGIVHLPDSLFETMKIGELLVVDVPVEARVAYLLRAYDWFIAHPEDLKERLARLKELRGKNVIARWEEMIDSGAWEALVRDLLTVHYDPLYNKSSRSSYTDDALRHVVSASAIGGDAFDTLAEEVLGVWG